MTALTVLSLLAAAGASWAFLGRGRQAESALRVVARVSLGARTGVALVDVGGRELLVAYGEHPPRLLEASFPTVVVDPPPEDTP